MTPVSLKLPAALHDRLVAAAKAMGKSKTAVVREALEAYLDGQRPSAGASCHELAQSLAGSLGGPRDLSAGRRHLKSFGK